ncbi:hypothetical protein JW916_13660 [Candidatus Sumerlaeota bacterium]|nr:hypothetical protein [Candidatus Sumerlaeota bacterium]
MKWIAVCVPILIVVLLIPFWGKSDRRAQELRDMSVLFSSPVLEGEEGLDILIPMPDSIDNTLLSNERTEDYIPESLQAFTQRQSEYRKNSLPATIALGDTVDVLKESKTRDGYPVFLVRTSSDTYAWVFGFHLEDKSGDRLGKMP